MGYYIHQRNADFTVSAENIEPCLAAIRAIPRGDGLFGGNKYSWVEDYTNAADIVEAFAAWRWRVQMDDDAIVDISFAGEKYGDDEVLWGAIAPYVESGSYIEMGGEEADIWRWTFNGMSFSEVTPELRWPGED